MSKSANVNAKQKSVAESHRDRAYAHIRRKILRGELLPDTHLSNRILAKEVGMSFIPVREAINQLVSEGLVSHRPKLGFFVKEFTREEIAEWYDLREAVEVHSVMKAAETINEDKLTELQFWNDRIEDQIRGMIGRNTTTLEAQYIEPLVEADAKFHLTILCVCGNRVLLKLIGQIRLMTQVFVSQDDPLRLHLLEKTRDEHQAIINCLNKGDAIGAAVVMKTHIRRGSVRAVLAYDRIRFSEAEMHC